MKLRMIRMSPDSLNELIVNGYTNAVVEFADGTVEEIKVSVDYRANQLQAEYYNDSTENHQ